MSGLFFEKIRKFTQKYAFCQKNKIDNCSFKLAVEHQKAQTESKDDYNLREYHTYEDMKAWIQSFSGDNIKQGKLKRRDHGGRPMNIC